MHRLERGLVRRVQCGTVPYLNGAGLRWQHTFAQADPKGHANMTLKLCKSLSMSRFKNAVEGRFGGAAKLSEAAREYNVSDG